jgi:hypothetical protein
MSNNILIPHRSPPNTPPHPSNPTCPTPLPTPPHPRGLGWVGYWGIGGIKYSIYVYIYILALCDELASHSFFLVCFSYKMRSLDILDMYVFHLDVFRQCFVSFALDMCGCVFVFRQCFGHVCVPLWTSLGLCRALARR